MTKGIKLIVLLITIALLGACASVKLVTRSKSSIPSNKDKLEGKSIGIVPFAVSFGASRFTVDLRDVTVTMGDQTFKLQTRYLAKDKDQNLGNIGILDVDILTKAKTDPRSVSDMIMEILKNGLAGTFDYHIGFFKGLGEDNMGELSNRPIDYDRSVYPPNVVFLPAENPAAFYQDIQVLDSDATTATAPTDLILTGDLSISSEVVEVLSNPNASESAVSLSEHVPAPGDYYLTLLGSLRFKVVDVKTGETVVSEKTKLEWPITDIIAKNILLPVKKGDADSYAKYFRTVDFKPIIADTLKNFIPSVLPLLAPYYVNTTHQEVIEK